MSNDVRINNNNSKNNNNKKKKKQEKKINETFILSTAYVWNKLYTNTTTSLNNFRVTTDIKMSPRKPVLAALLMLSKCLCFHYYVYSFLLHWVEFKLELMRKGYASQRIYVSISFTGPKFSLASGRKPRLPTSSQEGTGARGTRMDTFKCLYTWPVRLHLNWPIRIQQGKLYCPNVKCLSTGKALHSGNVSHWKRHQIFTKWDWKLKEPYQIV